MSSNSNRHDSKGGGTGGTEMRRIGRRAFLQTSALAGIAFSSGAGLTFRPANAAAPAAMSDFAPLSAFVTGRDSLSPVLAKRAHEQLVALDPDFDSKLAELGAAIGSSGAQSVDAFLATDPDAAVRETMTTITAAWYLGYTGTPDPSQETDDAKFVTYHDALMWQPTGDATPIPTYSQHKHNYWAEPPASIAND